MSQVYRYPLYPGEPKRIVVPRGSRPIHFGYQGARGEFSVWYHATDTDEEMEEVVAFVPTGLPIPLDDPEHIGSCVMHDGFHVFHAFRECRQALGVDPL